MGRGQLVWSSFMLAALVGSGVSCGGDGGSCAMVANCGGDVVGDWTVTSSCAKGSGTVTFNGCSTPGSVSASVKITGTLSFGSDLTYEAHGMITGSESILYPAACLTTAQGVTITCDQLTQFLAGTRIATGKCTASNGGCSCNLAIGPQSSDESGTYTVSGGILTTTPTGRAPATSGYCVQGNRFDYTPTMPMTNGLAVTGDVTLMRQ
ncbi:MAG TPA: hypothetical protein VFH68_22795 [Polyangia bacterium]|nr:hypothetical protein [Polyangia bacterium]